MTFVGRAKLNHPALGTPGGSSLHGEIENLFTSISDQLGSRWQLYTAIANGATITFEHGFSVPFEDLRVHIYTSTAGVQTRLTNLTGWTVEATAGFLQSKIDVTVPSSGGPYTFYLYVSQEPMSDKLSLTGGTISGELFLNHVVTDPKHGATKEYVDNLAQGLDVKDSVLVATTENITLSGTQTIDGIAVVTGNRVLVKDQTAKSENGIYTVASGSWTRSSDMNSWGEVPGAFCFVEEGTTNADTGWVCTSDITGILGTNEINWTQFAGVGTYTADGEGLELTGTQFGLELDGNSLSKSGSGLKVNPTGDVVSGSLSSGVINATGYQDYTGISTPSQPDAGKTRVYSKTDGKLYTQSPAGIESAVGSGGSILLINKSAHGFVAADVGCPVYLDGSGDYVKARADTSATAEVAGLINRIVDANNFEVCLGGEVSSVGANALSPLVPGEMYFLSPTTAGALQTEEPTVIGQVSKPLGVARTTSSISFFNMRGAVVGSVNARTDISLTNNGSKQIYTPPAGVVAGELQGFVEIDGSTDYRFHVQAQFARNGAGTDWNMSYQIVGDTPPVGFSMSINSSGVISVALPSIASFVSAKINYAINAPAVGATFPLSIDSTSVNFTDIKASTASGLTFKEDGGNTIGSVTDSGSWSFGSAASNTLSHNFRTGNLLSFNITNQPNGSISLCNGSGGNVNPTIIGKTASTNQPMTICSGTPDSNSYGDLELNVRKNDGTDFTTLTNNAFVFSRFGTTISTLSRAGRWTLGPGGNASTITHSVAGGLDIQGSTTNLFTYRPTSTTTDILLNIRSDVGGTASTRWRVEADGDTISTTGSYTSDIRVKKDVSEVKYGLKEILQLEPISYRWIYEDTDAVKSFSVASAQQIQQLMPEMVRDDGQEFEDAEGNKFSAKSVYEKEILAVMVKAIQELKAELDAAKTEIEILKSK